MIEILKKIGYSISAQLLVLIGSFISILFLPKQLSVADYACYQMFLMLQNCVCLFDIGWPDGLYLKIGGKDFSELDKPLLHKQYWAFYILQVCFFGMSLFISQSISDIDISRVFSLFSIGILIFVPRIFLDLLFQATYRIKECAAIAVIDRLGSLCFVILFLFLDVTHFEYYIGANLIGAFASLAFATYQARSIIFTPSKKGVGFQLFKKEVGTSIIKGFPLMIANFANQFGIVIIKMAIQYNWDLETFGKISFTFTFISFVLTFFRAVSLSIFPALRRTSTEKVNSIYRDLRYIFILLFLCIFVFYYPCKRLMMLWLPQYAESLNYLAILLPLCIFEARSTILFEGYLKNIGRERSLLVNNIILIGLSVVLAYIVCLVNSLVFAVFMIFLLYCVRGILLEYLVSKEAGYNCFSGICIDLLYSGIIWGCLWFFPGLSGAVAYAGGVAAILFLQRKRIVQIAKRLRSI